jgi:maltose/moltooligosaccharide transporter
MPDITPSKYRSQANGIINLMGGLGAIIAFLGGASLYEKNPDYPFWLGSGLVIIAAVLVFIFVREPKTYEESGEAEPSLTDSVKELFKEKDKSALLILGAIFSWFVAYAGIEAFFTLFGTQYLGYTGADAARLLGQLSLLFVIFALPAGYIGAAIGRRRTIMIGIVGMGLCIISLFILPLDTLKIVLATVPVLKNIPVVGVILMATGIAWAMININSLPMVVDMTDSSRIGTYTGLYYLFSTLAAIVGPIMYGWIIELANNQYNTVMLVSPIFMVLAFVCMAFVKRGEAKA